MMLPRSGDGVLLVHGVTGTPAEMRPLAKHLERLGYRVSVSLLAGHGAGHRELLATTYCDWLGQVRRSFNELAAECDRVVIAGLCGGGLLGALLAAEDPRVAGLVVLAPDLGHRAPGPASPWTRFLLPVASRVPWLRNHGYWTERPPYGIKDPRLQQRITRSIAASRRGQTAEYGTFRIYVGTICEMINLQEDVRRRAGEVTCPALIMHSVEDSLFTIRNATELYSLLGSRDKRVEFVSGCDHVMTVDLRKDYVAQRVGVFVQRLTDRYFVHQSSSQVRSSNRRHSNAA